MKSNPISRRVLVRGLTTGIASCWLAPGQDAVDRVRIGESVVDVTISGASPDLPRSELLAWVKRCGGAVAHYFGHFPVPSARLSIVIREERQGVSGGRTWGNGGARTRINVGRHTTATHLDNDWVLTHEFVHYGFPDVPERHHWIEEGLATYVEPLARVNAGIMKPATAWFEMLRDMPQGQPQEGDLGLDHTHTWARTYWGGALFCLLADVAIRKQSGNRKGLRDALRAIVAAGGNIEVEWPLARALEAGDRGVGGSALQSLYQQMGAKAAPVDLPSLWKELGVARNGETATFDDQAPLAAIRRAIL